MKIVFIDGPIPKKSYMSCRASKRNAFFEILDSIPVGKGYRFNQGEDYSTVGSLDQWLQVYRKQRPGSRMTRRKDGNSIEVWRLK